MSAEAINGYTLIAEPAHWADQPQWRLKWDTEIVTTLRGSEGRNALDEMPRPAISYKVQPMRIERQARLTAALIAGMASGKCCAPTFGRASWLAADAAAGNGAISIEPSAWNWAALDWLFIYTADGGHQIGRIDSIDPTGTIFTLAGPLAADCAQDAAVYPLLFGRPEISDIDQTNGSISAATITLTGDRFSIDPTFVPACCQAQYGGGGGGGDDLIDCAFLTNIWRTIPQGAPVLVAFDAPNPPGYKKARGCLRFIRVTAGEVTGIYCGDVTPTVIADVLTLADGGSAIYAVEFYGWRQPRKRTDVPHTPRAFIPSSDNFKIYLLNMS